ncbi:MAG: hypothetical protein GKS00_12345 [Alphaproteobacteria bacterium]|nr:hypothetical protein [Alphaproteobacteria bacterium]
MKPLTGNSIFRVWLFIVLGILTTAALALSVSAAERNGKNIDITVRLFDAVAVFPPPSWQESVNPADDYTVHPQQQQNMFVLEFLPKGETFKNWTKLHAVQAVKSPRLRYADLKQIALKPFQRACGEDNLEVRELEETEKTYLIALLCTNSPNGPTEFGYGDGVGEVTLMWIGYAKETKVKIYQHWRGDSFSTDEPDTWPVSADLFDRTVGEFKGIRLIIK